MFKPFIVTHPGGSHKDEFLACSLLVATSQLPIERREPTEEDLNHPEVYVIDVGGRHEPQLLNFDHHQFPRDYKPTCALSLVLQHLGLYDEAKDFCDWLEPAEWFDTRGPVETSKMLGVDRELMAKLNSPIDITLLRRFARAEKLAPWDPVWEVMKMIGEDLIYYLKSMKSRIEYLSEHLQIWNLEREGEHLKVAFLPREEVMPDEPSAGIPRYLQINEIEVHALIYPDRRGGGYGLSRNHDYQGLEFTRVDHCSDVHFAHARGFIAKTSALDPERLRELINQSWVSIPS